MPINVCSFTLGVFGKPVFHRKGASLASHFLSQVLIILQTQQRSLVRILVSGNQNELPRSDLLRGLPIAVVVNDW